MPCLSSVLAIAFFNSPSCPCTTKTLLFTGSILFSLFAKVSSPSSLCSSSRYTSKIAFVFLSASAQASTQALSGVLKVHNDKVNEVLTKSLYSSPSL